MRIGERGQVTIPKAIRDRFGLHAKTEVEFSLEAGAIVLKKARRSLAIRKWKASPRLDTRRWTSSWTMFADDDYRYRHEHSARRFDS
jgi:AbrB family looped-hinge helix DNA binding protein